jgi:hypothetical protein
MLDCGRGFYEPRRLLHGRRINIKLLFHHLADVLLIWNILQQSTRLVIIGVDSIHVWSDNYAPGCFERFYDKCETKSVGKRYIQETVCRYLG